MRHRGESGEAYTKKVTVEQVLKDEFNRKTQKAQALPASTEAEKQQETRAMN